MGDVQDLWRSNLAPLDGHGVVLLGLPWAEPWMAPAAAGAPLGKLRSLVRILAGRLRPGGKLLLLGPPPLLPHAHAVLEGPLRFHHWIAVRCRPQPRPGGLPQGHLGLTVYS